MVALRGTVAVAIAAGVSIVVADPAGAIQGVTVPQVPVPTVPAVPVPTVPPVSVPTPVGSVPTPVPVPKPSVPPPVTTPHVPTVQGLSGTGSTAPTGNSGSGTVPTPTAGGGSAPATTYTPSTAGSVISQGVPGTAPAPVTAEQRQAARRAERRKERRQGRHVRRALRRLGSCLGDLPREQRRVLVLRAAFGHAHPRTRAQVARRLDLRERRVKRLERRGLRRLRAADKAGGCAPLDTTELDGTSGTERALAGASLERTLLASTTTGTGSGGGGSGGGNGQSGVRGESKSSSGNGGGPATVAVPNLAPPGETQGGTDVALALLLLGVAAAALIVRQRLRSQDRADAS